MHTAPPATLVGAAVMKLHFCIFCTFAADMPKNEPSAQDREKISFDEMPSRNGAIHNRLRATKMEKRRTAVLLTLTAAGTSLASLIFQEKGNTIWKQMNIVREYKSYTVM